MSLPDIGGFTAGIGAIIVFISFLAYTSRSVNEYETLLKVCMFIGMAIMMIGLVMVIIVCGLVGAECSG